jgi:hypothetical protein
VNNLMRDAEKNAAEVTALLRRLGTYEVLKSQGLIDEIPSSHSKTTGDAEPPASESEEEPPSASPEYSRTRSPKRWRIIYAVDGVAISKSTWRRRIRDGDIRVDPTGTTRSVRIDKRYLPPGFDDDAN